MRKVLILLTAFLSLLPARLAAETPKVTPVDIDDDAPRTILHYYDKHGNELKEPVMFLAVLDTIAKPKSAPPYPLYNGYSVGVNFGDAILLAIGQKHAGFDIHADVSLHNWFFPTIECGVGFADSRPDHRNFHYRNPLSPFLRIGLNYNFLYKSDPAYQLYVGFRAGFSSFRYSIDDISIEASYWGEEQNFSLTDLKSYALWGEAVAGLKVKIVDFFSLGWSLRYKFPFHIKETAGGEPWYVPGFGATDTPVGISLSAIFTFGTKPPRKEGVVLPDDLPEVSREDIEETMGSIPDRRPVIRKDSGEKSSVPEPDKNNAGENAPNPEPDKEKSGDSSPEQSPD